MPKSRDIYSQRRGRNTTARKERLRATMHPSNHIVPIIPIIPIIPISQLEPTRRSWSNVSSASTSREHPSHLIPCSSNSTTTTSTAEIGRRSRGRWAGSSVPQPDEMLPCHRSSNRNLMALLQHEDNGECSACVDSRPRHRSCVSRGSVANQARGGRPLIGATQPCPAEASACSGPRRAPCLLECRPGLHTQVC